MAPGRNQTSIVAASKVDGEGRPMYTRMTILIRLIVSIAIALSGVCCVQAADAPAKKAIKALFLGDNGHHRPAERFSQLKPVMSDRGIDITYTENVADLNAENLAKYDCLIVYANTE